MGCHGNCISKFYVHDLTNVLVIVKFISVNPYIDPVLHILFVSIILRSFWKLKSPIVGLSGQAHFPPCNSGAWQGNTLLELDSD